MRDAWGSLIDVTAAVAASSRAATAADPLTHEGLAARGGAGQAPPRGAWWRPDDEPDSDHATPAEHMAVGDAMTRDPMVLRDDDAVAVAAKVLDEAHISGAPVVVTKGTLVGVLSRTDLLHARATERLWERWPGLRVRHLMHWPAITVLATLSLDEAAV